MHSPAPTSHIVAPSCVVQGLLGDAYLACRATNRSTCIRKAVLQYSKSLELTPATTPDVVIAHLRLARAYSAEHTMGNKPNGYGPTCLPIVLWAACLCWPPNGH